MRRSIAPTGLGKSVRHSHVSMLINMGFDIKEISECLGHESVQTTWDTYAHLYPDTDTKLAGELNKLWQPDDPEMMLEVSCRLCYIETRQ